jgi:hypothetical protein
MIVSVAMWIDGRVESLPKPNRHYDLIRKFPQPEHSHGDQGFIDDKRGFVSRQVALAIVEREDQPLRTGEFMAYGHGLFSEDLW